MFNYLRQRKIQSSIKKNKRQRSFLNFANIKNVLILFDNTDLKEIILIAKELEGSNRRVFLWSFDPDKNAIPPKRQSLSLQTITGKDISKLGGISKEMLAIFDSQIYDTIIDLTTTPQYPLQYLLANNNAMFSIGTTKSEEKLYDFVLLKDENMDTRQVFDQIKFYLNSIGNKTNNT